MSGACRPEIHYMVDLTSRLIDIKNVVDAGDYFTINRARQYGKTTTLQALASYLKQDYIVVSLDFQKLGAGKFVNENQFAVAFAGLFLRRIKMENKMDNEILFPLESALKDSRNEMELLELFDFLSDICANADRPIVLLIDEVDAATNNQVFLSFLAQLRADYLDWEMTPTFQSVVLAGVYDIRSMKRKLRPEDDHKENSPWNTRENNEPSERGLSFGECTRNQIEIVLFDCASDFDVDMSFGVKDIGNMLHQYEEDYHTGMDIEEISKLIYDYTSGYPVLVSRICKLLDEKLVGITNFPDKRSVWTQDGIMEAIKRMIKEDNPLYESMLGKLVVYPELKSLLQELLFNGNPIPYVATTSYIKDATMFGFIRNENDTAVISNRIFEAVLYNSFIAEEFAGSNYMLLVYRNVINLSWVGTLILEGFWRNSLKLLVSSMAKRTRNLLRMWVENISFFF